MATEETIIDWNDGWRRESSRYAATTTANEGISGDGDLATRMRVNQRDILGEKKTCGAMVEPFAFFEDKIFVRDDALSEPLRKELYDRAVEAGLPMGCYVTTPQVLLHKKVRASGDNCHSPLGACQPQKADVGTKDEPLSRLAAEIIAQVFLCGESPLLDRNDLVDIHGFMLWSLCGGEQSAVSYHIDYAEAIRHTTGIITPPLLGAVLHASELCSEGTNRSMDGGSLAINTRGLDHYREWGYKATFMSSDKKTGERVKDFDETSAIRKEAISGGWRIVEYKSKRAIVFRGDYPHAVIPVKSISPQGRKRVIVGINMFGHNVGHEASRFPDHSARSNRAIKLMQAFCGPVRTAQDPEAASGLQKAISLAKEKLSSRQQSV